MEVAAPIVVKKWLFTKVARAIHTGTYETVDQTYPKIFEFIGRQNLMPAGPTMERFLSDPQQVAPEELKTEIWVPVSDGQK
jgi:effector-binding domain-containing protein